MTVPGVRFGARVVASVAEGFKGAVYIAKDLVDYARIASALISDVSTCARPLQPNAHRRHGGVRARLARSRNKAALFDAVGWRRRFVTGLLLAWQTHLAGAEGEVAVSAVVVAV